MKLIPLTTTSRTSSGARLGYNILNKSKGAPTLSLSIHPDLVRKMKLKDGDILRIDGDMKEKIAQLTPVLNLGQAARRIHLAKSGRGDWSIPYSGLVKEAFAQVTSMTELLKPEITSDGLQFQLP